MKYFEVTQLSLSSIQKSQFRRMIGAGVRRIRGPTKALRPSNKIAFYIVKTEYRRFRALGEIADVIPRISV